MTAVFVECKPEMHNNFDGQYEGKIMQYHSNELTNFKFSRSPNGYGSFHVNTEHIDNVFQNWDKTNQAFIKFNDKYSYNMFLKYGSIVYCNINGNIQRGTICLIEYDNTTCTINKIIFDEISNRNVQWYNFDSDRYFIKLDDIDSILLDSDTYNICKKMEDNDNDDNIGIGSRVKQRHKLKKEQIEQKQREMDEMSRSQNELQIMFDEYRQNCIYYDCLLMVIILMCVFVSMIY